MSPRAGTYPHFTIPVCVSACCSSNFTRKEISIKQRTVRRCIWIVHQSACSICHVHIQGDLKTTHHALVHIYALVAHVWQIRSTLHVEDIRRPDCAQKRIPATFAGDRRQFFHVCMLWVSTCDTWASSQQTWRSFTKCSWTSIYACVYACPRDMGSAEVMNSSFTLFMFYLVLCCLVFIYLCVCMWKQGASTCDKMLFSSQNLGRFALGLVLARAHKHVEEWHDIHILKMLWLWVCEQVVHVMHVRAESVTCTSKIKSGRELTCRQISEECHYSLSHGSSGNLAAHAW